MFVHIKGETHLGHIQESNLLAYGFLATQCPEGLSGSLVLFMTTNGSSGVQQASNTHMCAHGMS